MLLFIIRWTWYVIKVFPRSLVTKYCKLLLKAIDIYSLVVLVARSLNSRCWQGGFLLEVLMVNLFHVSPLHSGEVKSLSRVWLFATSWTVAHQDPWSMGFSRHEYWSGLPFPSPGDLPDPGIETGSPALQADYLPSEPPGKPSNIYLLLSWNKICKVFR